MNPRLAIFEMHHLGDAVIALPFLRAASKHFETTVFCRAATADLLRESLPGLDVAPSEHWTFSGLPRLGSTDITACVWPDSRAHLAMRRTGAGRRIGFRVAAENFYGAARPWRKRRLIAGQFAERVLSIPSPLLTEPLDRARTSQTHGESWAQIASALGFEPDYSFPWLPLPPPMPLMEKFVQESRDAGKKVLALHPGGRLPGKRWEPGRFQKLLRGYLSDNEFSVAIIKPPGEQCPEPCNPWQRIFETESIPSLAALLAQADGVLCNDSLASHLAAAVGVPVATIFGSGDPAWFAPFGNSHLAIHTNACRFRPCVDRCAMPSLVCLESVSIHLVEDKLSAMFADPLQNPTS
jgi:ADP-heptose:LPS heptosyltransferase